MAVHIPSYCIRQPWYIVGMRKTAGIVAAALVLAGCGSTAAPSVSTVPVSTVPVSTAPPSTAPASASTGTSTAAASTPTATPARPGGSTPTSPAASPVPSASCAAQFKHIYHPYRLHLIRCHATLAGTVREVLSEADGDLHIWIQPDSASARLAHGGIHGWMTAEIICHGHVTQSDAMAACASYASPLPVPQSGDVVQVSGPYVLDVDHGWTEIHPITQLTITGHQASSTPTPPAHPVLSQAPPTTAPRPPALAPAPCYPKTAGGNCYEPGEFCPTADRGTTGLAGDGARITCRLSGTRWRWE